MNHKDRARVLSQHPEATSVSVHQILNNKSQQNAGVMLANNPQIKVGISVKPKPNSNKKVVKSVIMGTNLSPQSKKREATSL